jgi:hypothetical protein
MVGASVAAGTVAGGSVALAGTAVGTGAIAFELVWHPAITAPTTAVLNLRNPLLVNFFPFQFTITSTFSASFFIILRYLDEE